MNKIVDIRVVSVLLTENFASMPIRRPYSMHATGELIPLRVDMRWENVNDHGVELVRASVTGRRLKKDGTPGLADATTDFVRDSRWVQDIPTWLSNYIMKYAP